MINRHNDDLRRAIVAALPSDTSLHGEAPPDRHVYLPPSHVKALRPDASLVIGTRGAGKTFWSSALRSDSIRTLLESSVADLPELNVYTGYSETPDIDAYPDSDVFENLLSSGVKPYSAWRAVVARWAADVASEDVPRGDWRSTIDWVLEQPESLGRLLEQANDVLRDRGEHGLIVFDALDRSTRDWRRMDAIVRDLLVAALSLKPFRYMHAKVFLREDQFFDRPVANFPDASKLLATRVELTWASHDLHGLLWQYLCNAPGEDGVLLRGLFERTAGVQLRESMDGVWNLPDVAKRDEHLQRALFIAIAGEWMGRDRRRGVPYTWSIGHLADGRGRTSPRSFLAAVRAAAEDSLQRYPDHGYPLHFESIKRGVQMASAIRVSELAEDYPWVKTLMDPLRGLNVPCAFGELEERWQHEWGARPPEMESEKLPPEHHEEGWKGIKRDLESLGIFEPMKDGRVNMPDLYRVGFGLGRRGGVKPAAKAAQRW